MKVATTRRMSTNEPTRVVITTTDGAVFNIRENEDGSLSIGEGTFRRMNIHPEASNSVRISATIPPEFSER